MGGRGLLPQVGTGQGKSVIVALLSAVQTLLFDRRVDISTSSKLLAQRESMEQQDYFHKLSLSCGYIDGEKKENECTQVYKDSNTVFGTPHGYHGHILSEQSPRKPQNIRSGRGFECAILDEVDNMLIDCIMESTQLQTPTPGCRPLNSVLLSIWNRLCLIVADQGHPISYRGETIFLMSKIQFQNYLGYIITQSVNNEGNGNDNSNNNKNSINFKDSKYFYTLLSIIAINITNDVNTLLAVQVKYNIFKTIETRNDIINDLKYLFSNDIELFLQLLSEKAIFNYTIAFYHFLPKNNELTYVFTFENGLKCDVLSQGSSVDFKICLNNLDNKIYTLNETTVEDFEKTIKNEVKTHVLKTVGIEYDSNYSYSNNNKIKIPSFTMDYVKENCHKWIDSAWDCLFVHEENNDYIVDKNRNEIKMVDYKNTGLVRTKMKWSYGKHEILQLKHKLKLSTLGNASCIMTNTNFFGKYKRIYGLSGTLGDKTELDYYKEHFQCDYVSIPSFARNNLEKYPSLLCNNSEEWLNLIALSALSEAIKGRVCLIIAETIDNCDRIRHCINNMRSSRYNNINGYNSTQRIERYENNINECEMNIVKSKFSCGDIIVATNLAGRGTDIKYIDKVKENQGLHVIVTFIPQIVVYKDKILDVLHEQVYLEHPY